MLRKRNFVLLGIILVVLGFTIILPIDVILRNQAQFVDPMISQVEFNSETITMSQDFHILENAENNETLQNISSVPIDLENPRWNVSELGIEMNDMTFINETKIIEDEHSYYYSVSKRSGGYDQLAVQLEIPVPTIMYGIYIYGESTTDVSEDIDFEIQGYDKITGSPDGNIVSGADISLNMSKSNGRTWHFQKFNSPLSLSKGTYSIVINGNDLSGGSQSYYRWYCNNDNPKHPSLNISFYSDVSWDLGLDGTPFLYKLNQRVNDTFHPSDINMTADINDVRYAINDTNEKGAGNLSLSFDGFFPNATTLDIPITNNISEALIFNVSYYVKLNNLLTFSGDVNIRKGQDNIWILEPTLDRCGCNYSVIYDYPDHWGNLTIYKDDNNITDSPDIVDDGDYLYIYNSTISDGDDWKIEAISTRYDLTLTTGYTSYKTGERLTIRVDNLPNIGTYTFVFVDNIGAVEDTQIKEREVLDNFFFNYTIPDTAPEGEWIAYVSWTNGTDAGIQTQPFQITSGSTGGGTPFIDPFFLIFLFVLIGSVAGIGISSYVVIKNIREKRELHKKKLRIKVMDILNLQDVIIISTKTGLNVYEEHFRGTSVDATLVSGFLEAIRSFGIELTGSEEQTQSISLVYKELIVVMSEYKSARVLVIMSDKPSKDFQESVNQLSVEIEEQYGEKISNELSPKSAFSGIYELIKRHLNTDFILPLQIEKQPKINLTSSEKELVRAAKKVMKQKDMDHFFSSYLISGEKFRVEKIELIFDLLEKGVFQPIQVNSHRK